MICAVCEFTSLQTIQYACLPVNTVICNLTLENIDIRICPLVKHTYAYIQTYIKQFS